MASAATTGWSRSPSASAPHDCLRLLYDGDDKLFLPVENIEMLSRFGSDAAGVALDKLGGTSWQNRKARMKQRIRDMAGELIRVAAARKLRDAEVMAPAEGAWDEFCARFPHAETEDQARAIADVLEDLASGRPMDRLICGDVGFGKTEVALRAAFVAAMAGDAGGGGGADHAAVAPAFPHVLRPLPGPAGHRGAAVAHGDGEGGGRGPQRPGRRQRQHRHRHACAAGQGR